MVQSQPVVISDTDGESNSREDTENPTCEEEDYKDAMTMSIAAEATLLQTIATTDKENTQKTLNEICLRFPEARNFAASMLLATYETQSQTSEGSFKDKLGAENVRFNHIPTPTQAHPVHLDHQVTSRWKRCKICNFVYDVGDVEDNGDEACEGPLHDGEKLLTSEVGAEGFWKDYDLRNGLPIDLVDDSEYAKGFMWSCCGRATSHPTCREQRHEILLVQHPDEH